MPLLNPQPGYRKFKIEDIEEIVFQVPHIGGIRHDSNGWIRFPSDCRIAIKVKQEKEE